MVADLPAFVRCITERRANETNESPHEEGRYDEGALSVDKESVCVIATDEAMQERLRNISRKCAINEQCEDMRRSQSGVIVVTPVLCCR